MFEVGDKVFLKHAPERMGDSVLSRAMLKDTTHWYKNKTKLVVLKIREESIKVKGITNIGVLDWWYVHPDALSLYIEDDESLLKDL